MGHDSPSAETLCGRNQTEAKWDDLLFLASKTQYLTSSFGLERAPGLESRCAPSLPYIKLDLFVAPQTPQDIDTYQPYRYQLQPMGTRTHKQVIASFLQETFTAEHSPFPIELSAALTCFKDLIPELDSKDDYLLTISDLKYIPSFRYTFDLVLRRVPGALDRYGVVALFRQHRTSRFGAHCVYYESYGGDGLRDLLITVHSNSTTPSSSAGLTMTSKSLKSIILLFGLPPQLKPRKAAMDILEMQTQVERVHYVHFSQDIFVDEGKYSYVESAQWTLGETPLEVPNYFSREFGSRQLDHASPTGSTPDSEVLVVAKAAEANEDPTPG